MSELDMFLRGLAEALADEAQICFSDAEYELSGMAIERLADEFKKSLVARF